ncbi:unnamed protein product [Pleuronectes platessa]|uniref:Uncharacterized protein n=1 Tax=Pleuronectes platessa TaxID=8262 RepID=A0A9N7YMX5_PLEPL|nr:unnamed protein product [Pleuronectes platessa]
MSSILLVTSRTAKGPDAAWGARQFPGLVYTRFIYLWELSWGAGLGLPGACPWDYSGYRYNLRGLVTLEYAVPWAVAAFIAEQHVIKNTLRIRLHN